MHYNLLNNNFQNGTTAQCENTENGRDREKEKETSAKLNGSIKICKLNVRMVSIPLHTLTSMYVNHIGFERKFIIELQFKKWN